MKESILFFVIFVIVLILIIGLFLCFILRSRLKENIKKPKAQKWKGLCNLGTEWCSAPQMSHKCCADHVLELCRKLYFLCRQRGIPLCLHYGTLLGWRRHNGIIPWDNDLDLTTNAVYGDQIMELKPFFEKEGHVISRNTGKSFSPNDAPDYDYIVIFYSKTNGNHVDVALATDCQIGSENYVLDAPKSQGKRKDISRFKHHLILTKNLYPLRESLFYDIPVLVPSDPDSVLKYWYGEDVLTNPKKRKREGVPGFFLPLGSKSCSENNIRS